MKEKLKFLKKGKKDKTGTFSSENVGLRGHLQEGKAMKDKKNEFEFSAFNKDSSDANTTISGTVENGASNESIHENSMNLSYDERPLPSPQRFLLTTSDVKPSETSPSKPKCLRNSSCSCDLCAGNLEQLKTELTTPSPSPMKASKEEKKHEKAFNGTDNSCQRTSSCHCILCAGSSTLMEKINIGEGEDNESKINEQIHKFSLQKKLRRPPMKLAKKKKKEGSDNRKSNTTTNSSSKWRRESEQFRQAMRAARGVE